MAPAPSLPKEPGVRCGGQPAQSSTPSQPYKFYGKTNPVSAVPPKPVASTSGARTANCTTTSMMTAPVVRRQRPQPASVAQEVPAVHGTKGRRPSSNAIRTRQPQTQRARDSLLRKMRRADRNARKRRHSISEASGIEVWQSELLPQGEGWIVSKGDQYDGRGEARQDCEPAPLLRNRSTGNARESLKTHPRPTVPESVQVVGRQKTMVWFGKRQSSSLNRDY